MSVLEFAMNRVPKNILSILEYTKRNIKDVDLFALHQANRFIINAIRKKMNIEYKLMPNNIRDFGNTGSASIPLLLSDILGIKNRQFIIRCSLRVWCRFVMGLCSLRYLKYTYIRSYQSLMQSTYKLSIKLAINLPECVSNYRYPVNSKYALPINFPSWFFTLQEPSQYEIPPDRCDTSS